MTTNREKFEEVFAAQIAEAVVNDGVYAPGTTDEDIIGMFVAHNQLSEEDAAILLKEKREEWAAHKGERLFYYLQVVKFGVEEHLEVLKAWENELVDLFDTYDFSPSDKTDPSSIPYAVKKNA